MEVEIKLQLPDAATHTKVLEAFAPYKKDAFLQRNYFFDSDDGRVSKHKRTLRVRFFESNGPDKAVLTIKGRQELKDGVGRASEVEDDLDVDFAKKVVEEPSLLLTSDSQHLQQIKRDAALESLVCLGSFHNHRTVFVWEGQTLEVDETIYDATPSHPQEDRYYEIECELEEPETFKPKLEAFLKEHGINFKDNTSTKFGRLRKRTKVPV